MPPKTLYHRKNNIKYIDEILTNKEISISKGKAKGEGYNFVSLTEGRCVDTGGKFQLSLDANKILEKNEIKNIWKDIDVKDWKLKEANKKTGSFLHELEWRSNQNVKFDHSDVKELTFYKNGNTNIKEFNNTCAKHRVPCRIVKKTSTECNEKEKKEEFTKVTNVDYREYFKIKNIEENSKKSTKDCFDPNTCKELKSQSFISCIVNVCTDNCKNKKDEEQCYNIHGHKSDEKIIKNTKKEHKKLTQEAKRLGIWDIS